MKMKKITPIRRASIHRLTGIPFLVFCLLIKSSFAPPACFGQTLAFLAPPDTPVFVVRDSLTSLDEPVTISYRDSAGNTMTEEIIYRIEKRKIIYSDGRTQIESKGNVINRPIIHPETGTLTLFEGNYICLEDTRGNEAPRRRGARTLAVTRVKPQQIFKPSAVEHYSKVRSRYEYVIDGDTEYLKSHSGRRFESTIEYGEPVEFAQPDAPTNKGLVRGSRVIIRRSLRHYDPQGRIIRSVSDLQKRSNTFDSEGQPQYDRFENIFKAHDPLSDRTAPIATNYKRTTRFHSDGAPRDMEVVYITHGTEKSRTVETNLYGGSNGKLNFARIKEYHGPCLIDHRLWLPQTQTQPSASTEFRLTNHDVERLLGTIRSWETSYAANGQPASPFAFPFEV
jgi:hypothetical protein